MNEAEWTNERTNNKTGAHNHKQRTYMLPLPRRRCPSINIRSYEIAIQFYSVLLLLLFCFIQPLISQGANQHIHITWHGKHILTSAHSFLLLLSAFHFYLLVRLACLLHAFDFELRKKSTPNIHDICVCCCLRFIRCYRSYRGMRNVIEILLYYNAAEYICMWCDDGL